MDPFFGEWLFFWALERVSQALSYLGGRHVTKMAASKRGLRALPSFLVYIFSLPDVNRSFSIFLLPSSLPTDIFLFPQGRIRFPFPFFLLFPTRPPCSPYNTPAPARDRGEKNRRSCRQAGGVRYSFLPLYFSPSLWVSVADGIKDQKSGLGIGNGNGNGQAMSGIIFLFILFHLLSLLVFHVVSLVILKIKNGSGERERHNNRDHILFHSVSPPFVAGFPCGFVGDIKDQKWIRGTGTA